MRACVGVLLIVLIGFVALGAQAPPARRPVFEVASVKRNVSGRIGGDIQVPPAGALSFTNVMLRILIRDAHQVNGAGEQYKLDPGQYAHLVGRPNGGPQPDVPRFDVRARPPDNTSPAERRAMMRSLLEDRFKLRVHREMRQMPVYALTVAREGRLGPNFAKSRFDCQTYLAQIRAGRVAEEPADAEGKRWCQVSADLSRPNVYTSRFAGPVTVLVQRVQPYLDRPVVDSTGLAGNYEWVLTFSWPPNPSADAPDIVTALQEQLGLKAQARQGPVEVLVVDHVELPTPD
jgi:uncharacterized protein (TIGR03435 family)